MSYAIIHTALDMSLNEDHEFKLFKFSLKTTLIDLYEIQGPFNRIFYTKTGTWRIFKKA